MVASVELLEQRPEAKVGLARTLIVIRTRSWFWSLQTLENVTEALRVSPASCHVDGCVPVSVHHRYDGLMVQQQVHYVRLTSQNGQVQRCLETTKTSLSNKGAYLLHNDRDTGRPRQDALPRGLKISREVRGSDH